MSSLSAAGAAPSRIHGRTRIAPRALSALAQAVAADALGVPAGSIKIELSDDSGRLAVAVRGPLRVPSLDRILADPQAVQRTGGSVVHRAEEAEHEITQRVGDLTGSDVSRVVVRVTGADIRQENRVR